MRKKEVPDGGKPLRGVQLLVAQSGNTREKKKSRAWCKKRLPAPPFLRFFFFVRHLTRCAIKCERLEKARERRGRINVCYRRAIRAKLNNCAIKQYITLYLLDAEFEKRRNFLCDNTIVFRKPRLKVRKQVFSAFPLSQVI